MVETLEQKAVNAEEPVEKKAIYVRDMSVLGKTNAALYILIPPHFEHLQVVVSAIGQAFDHGRPEVLIFPYQNGEINFLELDGIVGSTSHDSALYKLGGYKIQK